MAPKWIVLSAFILAGAIGGLYAVVFLKWGVKLNALFQEHDISRGMEDFLRRLS